MIGPRIPGRIETERLVLRTPGIDEGDRIEAGQTIGLIEVMKSFHEVTADRRGIVRRFLVDEGEMVEYGQPLMEIDPLSEG